MYGLGIYTGQLIKFKDTICHLKIWANRERVKKKRALHDSMTS